MKVNLCLLGTKIETFTYEISTFFAIFALIPFGKTVETRSVWYNYSWNRLCHCYWLGTVT